MQSTVENSLTALETHIELDGTYLNVIKFGSGEKNLTVIAGVSLCGLEGMGEQLESAFDCWKKDFTVYVFDRKKVLPENYTMNEMAEDIYKCLSRLGIKKTSIYGTSQGGMLGMLLVMHHPELAEKLVLCSTTPRLTSENEAFSQWKEAARANDIIKLNTLFLDNVYSKAYKESIKEYIPELLKKGTAEDCQRFLTLLKSMDNFDITNQLSKIKCPVLVICDNHDKVFDYKESLNLSELLKCKKIVFDKYSHAVYDEEPEIKNLIADFCK